MTKPINILILVAGTNERSNSSALASAFRQGIEMHDAANVHTCQLKYLNIEHFSLDVYEANHSPEADFKMIQSEVESADGLVIATPVWNFSVPAHLKNLLDRFGSFALDDTRSKGTLGGLPFYLIFTGGAPFPAWKGLMQKTTSHVAESLQYFGASFIGHHFEPKCTKGRGKFGLVVDERPESMATVRQKGFEFAKVVSSYKETGKAPLKNRVRGTVMGWGEKILKMFG